MAITKKSILLFCLPAIIVSVIFVLGHTFLVKSQPTRDQLHEMIAISIPGYGEAPLEELPEEPSEDTMVDEAGTILFKNWNYYPFTAAFASNLADESGILTIEIAVSLYDFEAATEVMIATYEKPAIMATIRSAILFALSSKDRQSVEGRVAQAALEEELLNVVNETLKDLKLEPDIKDLHIIRFIIV
tara:strand:+ start:1740 stop:2303 length:564 start_codon:yes stop_codon:yes gene_type:complete